MITNRAYLAGQVKALQLALSELAEWTDNPARQFPGDASVLADQLRWVAVLLVADDEIPEGPATTG